MNFSGKGRERRAPIQRQHLWLEVREGTAKASRRWHRGDRAVVPLPVCQKTSVCGGGEKQPRAAAAAAAAVTAPPGKSRSGCAAEPAQAPSTEGPPSTHSPLSSAHRQPQPALCPRQPLWGWAGSSPSPRCLGGSWVLLWWLWVRVALWDPCESRGWAGGRGGRAVSPLPASLSCSPVSREDLAAGGM